MSGFRYGRSLFWGGAVMALGYGVMVWTTPTDDQLYERLSPELKRKVDARRRDREASNRDLQEYIQRAAKSDRPAWQVADPFGGKEKGTMPPYGLVEPQKVEKK